MNKIYTTLLTLFTIPVLCFGQDDTENHRILRSDSNLVWVDSNAGDTLFYLRSTHRITNELLSDGVWTIFKDDSYSQKLFETKLVNHKEEGERSQWFWDGKLASKKNYLNGQVQFSKEWYNWEDSWVEQTSFDNGVPVKSVAIDSDGLILSETFYRWDEKEKYNKEFVTIYMDPKGLATSASRFEIDTVEVEFEGELFEVIQEINVNLDSLYRKMKTNR